MYFNARIDRLELLRVCFLDMEEGAVFGKPLSRAAKPYLDQATGVVF